ncbi:hypothetical protein FRC02_001762 [Tulasnella sp. 418]|nr:hypothetical protein FRC02_001762 [Tulasnella sp. 418]
MSSPFTPCIWSFDHQTRGSPISKYVQAITSLFRHSKSLKPILDYMVTMKKRLGLDPEILTLEHFAAGAGYAEAAVYHNLSDPPFVYNLHWAIAEFVVPPKPSYAANATVIVPTVAVETECNCDQADSVDLTLASAPGGNHTFTGKWYDCTITLQIPDEGIDQYGVETIMECPSNAAQPPWFKPITFWFLSSEIKQVAMVFCQPKVSVYNVLVEADLGTGLLKEVTVLDQNVPKNEMSGEPMNGRGYNGIAFDMSQAGRYGPARAISIQTGLPAAIHKLAQTSPGGVPAVMKNVDGFWWLTKMTYTRYLSIVAKSAYFVDDHDTINSIFENYEIRIFV